MPSGIQCKSINKFNHFQFHLPWTRTSSSPSARSYANCLCNQLAPAIYSSPTTNWSTLASSIKLLYDAEKNYMPQYDGYTPDMEIKQADVVLLAYPLQYRMNVTTKRNNLNIYANVTRATGPAMTWSMHALGHLDIGETPNESLFNSTHLPYIRWPFYTWNEYVNGVRNGAENFITGAGGFLQLIIYGYAGIRLNTDALIINGAQLPPRTTRLYLNGTCSLAQKSGIVECIFLPPFFHLSSYFCNSSIASLVSACRIGEWNESHVESVERIIYDMFLHFILHTTMLIFTPFLPFRSHRNFIFARAISHGNPIWCHTHNVL